MKTVQFEGDYGNGITFEIPHIWTDDIDFEFENLNQIASKNGHDEESSIEWLRSVCDAHVAKGNMFLTSADFMKEILRICKEYDSEEKIQSVMYELVGDTGFDLMLDVIGKKSQISKLSYDELITTKVSKSVAPVDFEKMSINQRRKYQKNLDIKRKKEMEENAYSSSDWLQAAGFSEQYLDDERMLGLQGGSSRSNLDTWHDNLAPNGTLQYHEKKSLPAGTQRKYCQGFEEVYIPAMKKLEKPGADELINVSQLEPWAQLAFEGIKRLNRIQSRVFDVAYNTSENMLICAPTGAGKTNIAMLAFLQLVKQHVTYDEIDKQAIKAIYIAPMKALAQEVRILLS